MVRLNSRIASFIKWYWLSVIILLFLHRRFVSSFVFFVPNVQFLLHELCQSCKLGGVLARGDRVDGFSSSAFSNLPSRTATFRKPSVVANLLWLSSLDLKSAGTNYLGRFSPKYGHVLAVVISAPYPSPTQTSIQHQFSTCFHKSAHASSEHKSWLQTAHMILLRTMQTVRDYRPNI